MQSPITFISNLCDYCTCTKPFSEAIYFFSHGRRNVSAARLGYHHLFSSRCKKLFQLKSSAAMPVKNQMSITCSRLNLVKSTGFMTCLWKRGSLSLDSRYHFRHHVVFVVHCLDLHQFCSREITKLQMLLLYPLLSISKLLSYPVIISLQKIWNISAI